MTYKSKTQFQIKRLLNFLKIFARNKRGIIGLAIILFFSFLSLAGPILTPYNQLGEDPKRPHYPVSARMSKPEWLLYLPTFLGGDPDLSKSMWIVNNPGSPKIIQEGGEWNLNASQEFIDNKILTIKFNETTNYPYSNAPGSLQVTFTRESDSTTYGNVTVTIYKEFYWPYKSKPGRFIGFITLLAQGTTNATSYLKVPVEIQVFLEQVEQKIYLDLWPPPLKVQPPGSTIKRWMPVTLGIPTGFIGETYGETYSPAPPEKGDDVYIGKPEAGANVTNGWIIAATSYASNWTHIDSLSSYLTNRVDIFPESEPLLAFSKRPGTYRYGVKIIFRDWKYPKDDVQTTIFVDQFDFGMLGNSFGLLGTNHLGQDLFSQLIYGAQASLYVGLLSAILGVVIGLIVGLASGYLGKAVDEILMRFSDMLLVLPSLPLLIVLVAILGSKLENLIILLGFLGWMGFARLVRSQVLSLRERPFVEAAKAVGAGKSHILFRHILPNVMGLVYVSLATSVPGAIVAEAALSWLGFVDPYRVSWGRMLNEAQEQAATSAWWWVIPPGLCIAALAVAFILLGFAIDDILNPKLRVRR
jgi:ABC-type dipeptide/oligopeptide/nickel transport system permease subunit